MTERCSHAWGVRGATNQVKPDTVQIFRVLFFYPAKRWSNYSLREWRMTVCLWLKIAMSLLTEGEAVSDWITLCHGHESLSLSLSLWSREDPELDIKISNIDLYLISYIFLSNLESDFLVHLAETVRFPFNFRTRRMQCSSGTVTFEYDNNLYYIKQYFLYVDYSRLQDIVFKIHISG